MATVYVFLMGISWLLFGSYYAASIALNEACANRNAILTPDVEIVLPSRTVNFSFNTILMACNLDIGLSNMTLNLEGQTVSDLLQLNSSLMQQAIQVNGTNVTVGDYLNQASRCAVPVVDLSFAASSACLLVLYAALNMERTELLTYSCSTSINMLWIFVLSLALVLLVLSYLFIPTIRILFVRHKLKNRSVEFLIDESRDGGISRYSDEPAQSKVSTCQK